MTPGQTGRPGINGITCLVTVVFHLQVLIALRNNACGLHRYKIFQMLHARSVELVFWYN